MPDISKFKTVICEADGPILKVTLNRPERLNAFNSDMFVEVVEAARFAATHSEIRIVVYRGAGRAFSSGADLSDIAKNRPEVIEDSFVLLIKELQQIFDEVETIPKPTIAAINGYAVGAGLQLALACDFRIAAKGAKIGLPDVKNGIIPALGATVRLPRLIGLARSKELIMLGDMITAEEAFEIGLVNRVVESDSLDSAVCELSEKLLERAPLALAASKKLLNSDASLDQTAQAQADLFKTADAAEGIIAFIEKRKPKFIGS
ncbi:MAG: hypothetical protein GY847_20505 [Proteobacteria bacterium]|nr:hypothetical protein [Pseudomonadota bacterium]